MTNLNATIAAIEANLEQAKARLTDIETAMEFLHNQGMYPCAATEQWQTRPNGQSEYLYMIFSSDGNGGYQGPDGKRKIYVGADPERIAAAKRMNINRREYNLLARYKQSLIWWIQGHRRSLDSLIRKIGDLHADTITPPGDGRITEILNETPNKLPTL